MKHARNWWFLTDDGWKLVVCITCVGNGKVEIDTVGGHPIIVRYEDSLKYGKLGTPITGGEFSSEACKWIIRKIGSRRQIETASVMTINGEMGPVYMLFDIKANKYKWATPEYQYRRKFNTEWWSYPRFYDCLRGAGK
jgi:hypothetical protein